MGVYRHQWSMTTRLIDIFVNYVLLNCYAKSLVIVSGCVPSIYIVHTTNCKPLIQQRFNLISEKLPITSYAFLNFSA